MTLATMRDFLLYNYDTSYASLLAVVVQSQPMGLLLVTDGIHSTCIA